MDKKTRWLLQHMFSDAIPSQFQLYRDRWYPLRIANSAAIDQMLATYTSHFSQDRPGHDLKHFILTNHTRALVGVRNSLDSPLVGYKQAFHNTLSVIAALACYSHLQRDILSWTLHMTAVAQLIEKAGFALDDMDAKVINLVRWFAFIHGSLYVS
ncbi:hypothetical protein BDW59DRAFT_149418 [Aspergillus cavernicola]|uniref:Uncharacterized protein n=1 Tax=Aspergillus cavernicola TaxID=176166 RepID=A0ABR4I4Q2_9EURO